MSAYPRGEPRSVADPEKDGYDEMIQQHRWQKGGSNSNGRAGDAKPAAPPTVLRQLNFARDARAKWEAGDRGQAVLDGLAGVADVTVGGSIVRGLLRGEVKIQGPHKWRTKPWEEGRGARQWMGDKGILKPGQHGHHAIISHKGLGKLVPDLVKNQPWNIKGTESPEIHGRIHGPYKGKPQFGFAGRYWYGTPAWWKAANASALTHGFSEALDRLDEAVVPRKR